MKRTFIHSSLTLQQEIGYSIRDDVVRVTCVLPDGKEFQQCRAVLCKYFGEIRPAAMMITAKLMYPRMRFGIDVTTLKGGENYEESHDA